MDLVTVRAGWLSNKYFKILEICLRWNAGAAF